MTVPRWLLAILVLLALVGVALGGYVIGRESVEPSSDRYSEGYEAGQAAAASGSEEDGTSSSFDEVFGDK